MENVTYEQNILDNECNLEFLQTRLTRWVNDEDCAGPFMVRHKLSTTHDIESPTKIQQSITNSCGQLEPAN